MNIFLIAVSLSLAAGTARAQAPDSDEEFARSLSLNLQPKPAAPAPGRPIDALGRPVGADAQAAFSRVLSSIGKRKLTSTEEALLLAILNNPPMANGEFKTREDLARYFAQRGVSLSRLGDGGVTESDLWRLVRAARAASESFKIPPAILLCLTFQESAFNRGASAGTTSAKGLSQMTNPAVSDVVAKIRRDAAVRRQTQEYARLLGAKMPEALEGAPDVDKLTRELDALRKSNAPAADISAKKAERQRAIASHKDEAGHIYNIETNFGLGAAYLSGIHGRLSEISGEQRSWLTAVGAYNQGLGTSNDLIYRVYGGPAKYNAAALDEIYSPETLAKLKVSKDFQDEMLGYVRNIRRCSCP